MTMRITAVYENGVFRPTGPVPLKDGDTVEVTIQTPAPPISPTEEEVIRRIESAKTLEELFAAMNEAPDDDSDYDLLEALNENRRQAGARLLFPPEMKGISW